MTSDIWVWVSDSSTVMSDHIRNPVLSHGLSPDCTELELSLLGIDFVCLESTLHIIEDSEVLIYFLYSDYIHDAEGESGVSSNLSVDLDQSFLVSGDLDGLLSAQCIAQSISKKDSERKAFLSLVGTS